jgi:hypothetical protein
MTDACPRCLRRDIPPAATRTRGPATVTGYRCPCGHGWATSRLNAAYPAAPTAAHAHDRSTP